MTYRSGVVTGVIFTLLAVGGVFAAWQLATSGRRDSKPETRPAPAAVPKTLKEESINVITLSVEAIDNLALCTAVAEQKSVPRARIYAGEIMIPAGRAVVVSAPLAGTLRASAAPQPGRAVKKGDKLLELLPLLTPEGKANLASAKIDAEGQVQTAQTSLKFARVALERAQKVFESDAGSRRSVDEAQAQYDLARKSLDAVLARQELLDKVVGEVARGTAAPIAIESPQDGLLRTVSVLPGQSVPTGATLFEVVNLGRVWVRVPVPVGDLLDIDMAADASIGELAGRSNENKSMGKPVPAPPSADPAGATVDRFFDLDNADARYSPGQRVGATLKLRSNAARLTVPWKSVVHDIHGGTWLYIQTGERTFERRRIVVEYVVGDTAVLKTGPDKNTRIVTDGAYELFGAESGFTK